MASLRTAPGSPYWLACFRRHDGRQTTRSTKLRATQANYRRAMDMAEAWEDAYKEARTARHFRKVLESIETEVLTADQSPALGAYVDRWLAERVKTVSPGTAGMYRSKAMGLIDALGASRRVSSITRADMLGWRDALLERVTAQTAGDYLSVARAIFADAITDGLLAENPAVIRRPKFRRGERRAFSATELRALWEAADDDWRGMLLLGLYTGQRIRDLANLQWGQVSLDPPELRMRTAKTDRPVLIPLPAPVADWLRSREVRELAVFPGLAGLPSSTTSRKFREVMDRAGVGTPIEGQRFNPLSFHSLRHTLPSLLAEAGTPAQVIQQIVGHSSAAMTWHYTHVSREAIEGALGKVVNPFR